MRLYSEIKYGQLVGDLEFRKGVDLVPSAAEGSSDLALYCQVAVDPTSRP